MNPSRAAWLSSTLATCLVGTASAGPLVWASMGEDAYRLLRRAGAQMEQVEPHALPSETIYLMRVDEDALPRLSRDVHEQLHRCGGYIVHASRAEGRQTLARFKSGVGPQGKVSYAIDDAAEVNALLPQLQESQVRSSIVQLSTAYKNRYYTTTGGVNASDDLAQSWKQLAAGRTDVTVKQFTHPSWPQKSVILTIKGTTRPKQIVVIGGHLDSTVGFTPTLQTPP